MTIATVVKELRTRAEQEKPLIVSPCTTLTPAKPNTLPQPETCPECNGRRYFKRDVPVDHPQFGQLIRCHNQYHNRERLERVAKVSGLEADDLDITLRDINPSPGNRAALNACREMIDDPYGWLWVWGGPGNAKSDMLMAVVNEFNKAGRMAVYMKFSRLIEYMRDVYKERKRFKSASDPDDVYSSYEARFQRMLNIPVLAIDEMDKIRFTEFVDEFRFDFLDDRWRQGIRGTTITLFASNDNPNTLTEPIWDRVRDGRFKVVANTQPSARPVMRR